MNTEIPRTSYARAVRDYDETFKQNLISAIVRAIAEASICTDDTSPRIMALRVGESLEALISCLISFAAMSPHFDTPSHLREFAETLAKRFRRDVARARAEGIGEKLFFGVRKGGNA
jgi:hypothetical protein